MKIATKNPNDFINELKSKIVNKEIRSWDYKNNNFIPQGKQYINHICYKHTINNDKSIIEFILESDGDAFAELRAQQLLESMLIRHFSSIIEIIR